MAGRSAVSGMPMSEDVLQAAIVDLASALGWLVYHTHDSRRSQKGFPDLVLVRRGRLLFVELKDETGPLRVEQAEWLAVLDGVAKRIGGLLDERAWSQEVPYPVEVRIWRPEDWRSGAVERELRAA